jgi:hypothetical protein
MTDPGRLRRWIGVMTGRALRAEFERRGVPAGRAMVFDEDTAVALINRAEDEYVAVFPGHAHVLGRRSRIRCRPCFS